MFGSQTKVRLGRGRNTCTGSCLSVTRAWDGGQETLKWSRAWVGRGKGSGRNEVTNHWPEARGINQKRAHLAAAGSYLRGD